MKTAFLGTSSTDKKMDNILIQKLKSVETPAYIIDEIKIRQNLEKLALLKKESGITLLIALKAFSSYHCFPLIRPYVDGFTASSLNELRLGDEYIGKHAHIYSPGYKEIEREEIGKKASHIIFNSHTELNRHLSAFKKINAKIEIGLRINPEHSEVETSLYNPCAPCSRFGVTLEEFKEEDLKNIDGILIHALCGKGPDALERLIQTLENKFAFVLQKIKWLDLGGGHSITKKSYDIKKTITILKNLKNKYPHLEIILEPGEAFIYDAGYLVSSILDITKNSVEIAILDTSATTHMPDVLEMPYTPEIVGAKPFGEKKYAYNLGGVTCLSGDNIGSYSFDTPLKVGDKLIFEDMAQYSIVKNTTFNGINLPDICILRENGQIERVKKFGYDSFISRL